MRVDETHNPPKPEARSPKPYAHILPRVHDPAVFAARRDAVMGMIGPNAVAVVASQPERIRNGDAHYLFRQASDVVYLTGFAEPQTVLVLRPGAETDRVVMFVRPRDPEHEVWDGRRAGVEGAKARLWRRRRISDRRAGARGWATLIANFDELHFGLGIDDAMDRIVAATIARLRKLEKRGQRPPRAVVDPRVALHELRLIKRPEELAALRSAAAITAEAHRLAMHAGKPGVRESELDAVLGYTFRRRGGDGPGYSSIVGAGVNATILHYVDNAATIGAGDLVLVDAGCEYGHYTADVTRTWPANGRFTPEQRAVYEVVLRAQLGAIALARGPAPRSTRSSTSTASACSPPR